MFILLISCNALNPQLLMFYCNMDRYAPSPDPSLNIKFYERTPEQQALLGYLVDPSQRGESSNVVPSEGLSSTSDKREPHGSVGAAAGHRAIAQSNSAEIADALFRYSAPEEVSQLHLFLFCIAFIFFVSFVYCVNHYMCFDR